MLVGVMDGDVWRFPASAVDEERARWCLRGVGLRGVWCES